LIKKIRRHLNVLLRRKHLEKKHRHTRNGDCKRCGNCCKIWFRCPFLIETDEGAACKIYSSRPMVCRVFPLMKRDLEEVRFRCGFKFDE